MDGTSYLKYASLMYNIKHYGNHCGRIQLPGSKKLDNSLGHIFHFFISVDVHQIRDAVVDGLASSGTTVSTFLCRGQHQNMTSLPPQEGFLLFKEWICQLTQEVGTVLGGSWLQGQCLVIMNTFASQDDLCHMEVVIVSGQDQYEGQQQLLAVFMDEWTRVVHAWRKGANQSTRNHSWEGPEDLPRNTMCKMRGKCTVQSISTESSTKSQMSITAKLHLE